MRIFVIAALMILVLGVPARADMIEANGEILNGTVISQDEKEVRFRDSKGTEHVFARSVIGYLEFEKTPTKSEAVLNKAKLKAQDAIESIKKAPKAVTEKGKVVGKKAKSLAKPVDRSSADKKSKELSESAGGSKSKQKKSDKKGSEGTHSGKASKGRFRSL
jgi:hypothetical protein